MEEDKDINEKFEELVRKAEDESNKLQKKYDLKGFKLKNNLRHSILL